MSTLRLLVAEIFHRPLNFLLCILAVATAATLFVGGPLVLDAHVRVTGEKLDAIDSKANKTLAELDKQTKRIMRDIGVNLRIVHKDTNFGDLFFDYKAVAFPQSDVETLANAPNIDRIVHLVATVNQRIVWNEKPVLVVGVLPVETMSQKNAEKPHMVKHVKPGTVHVGQLLGEGIKSGDTVEIKGESFQVASIQPSRGTREDQQLLLHLADAQRLFGLEGKVHQILALSCKCKGVERLSQVVAQLETALPHVKVTEMEARASAREKQRDLVTKKRGEQIAALTANRESSEQDLRMLVRAISPLVVGVSALFVGLLTWLNVRERRTEIGILRALGRSGAAIAGLILAKALLIGLLGGLAGCFAGGWAAKAWTASAIDWQSMGWLFGATLIGAPVVAILSSYLPTLTALIQDPSTVLSEG